MKKTLAMIICIAMLLGTMTVVASAYAGADNIKLNQQFVNDGTFVIGDADGNRSCNAKDALLIKGYVVDETDGIGEYGTQAADIDADGDLTARDCYYLKASFAGTVSLSNFEDASKQVYKMKIAGTDISKFKIVLPQGYQYESNAYCAYELLSKYIKHATGVTVGLETGTASTGHGIYINTVDRNSAQGKELGIEGYKYEVKNGNLNLYGTYRGNMYAAYEILEKYLGYRFFDNNYTYQYKVRVANLENGLSVQYVPPVTYRYVGQVMGTNDNMYPTNARMHYAMARKINATENVNDDSKYGFKGTQYQGMAYYGYFTGPVFCNAHSFYYLFAMGAGTMGTSGTEAERYYQKYQSGYSDERGMGNWQPCLTNSQVFNVLYDGLVDTTHMINARGYNTKFGEGIGMMAFSVNDNDRYCTCANCYNMAINQGEGYFGVTLNAVNVAARQITSVFPGMRLMTCLYFEAHKQVPKTIRPESNVVIMYCGIGCGNHYITGSECSPQNVYGVRVIGDFPLHLGNDNDQIVLPKIAQMCKEAGAEIWFWDYPTVDSYTLFDSPNVTNIWYTYNWLYRNGVTGFFYEGDPLNQKWFLFEGLKGYLAAQMEWNPTMSYEEFTAHLKEYLHMYYGEGYEDMYEYLLKWEAAGDAAGCWQCAYDRAFNMFDETYLAVHYEEMRALLESARNASVNAGGSYASVYEYRIECQLLSCDLLGLQALYNTWFASATAAKRNLYETRVRWCYNFIREHKLSIFDIDGVFNMPGSPSFAMGPLAEIYNVGGESCVKWAR